MNYIRIDATNIDGFTSVLPARYFDGADICLGAYEEDGSVCGAISLSFDGIQYDIDWLYVVPQKRLAGVGTGLLREIRNITAELGNLPFRAQFDTEEDTGLYAFFLSVDDPDFTVDVEYSHDRYFLNTKDFIESFRGGDLLKLPRPRLFWSLNEKLKEQALTKAVEHLEITDIEKFEDSCEKTLCLAVSEGEKIVSFMLVQNTPSGDLSLTYLYAENQKALFGMLKAAAIETQENFKNRTVFFDAVTAEAEALAYKVLPGAMKHAIYEAEI